MGVLVALALVSGGGQAMPPPQHRGAPKIHDVSSPPAIAAASDLPPGDGPRGTSGEVRDDSVGFAAVSSLPVDPQWSAVTMAVAHPNVPPGTPVEITALDTGRTILALVVARDTSRAVVSLSPATAQALGVGDRAPVRVRAVVGHMVGWKGGGDIKCGNRGGGEGGCGKRCRGRRWGGRRRGCREGGGE